MSNFEAICLEEAAKSKCENRKVGCILVSTQGTILGRGHNRTIGGSPCVDAKGASESNVVHAEVAAIENYLEIFRNCDTYPTATKLYVTHTPCPSCVAAIAKHLVSEIDIIVVGNFMKFDTDKLRYDLVPCGWTEGDAEILTFGAKKYKPSNWKEVDDIGRYFSALERHLISLKKYNETGDKKWLYDEETGLHHAKHLRTNAGFIMTLTGANKDEHS